ncbi:hypothetical protein [Shewanella sp. YIC-542]|uniref:hypothetical protein n=1 Tax=Shewanella mytili TaxID=3377111 RepID=UPI00398F6AAD
MIISDEKETVIVEDLLTKIKNEYFPEDVHPFPEFPLKDGMCALIWHENEEYEFGRNSWIDKNTFLALKEVIENWSNTSDIYIAWAFRELNELGQPLPRVVIKLPLNWPELSNYESKIDYSISQFYVFDECLDWFIYVDDSVMLAGWNKLILELETRLDGSNTAIQMFDEYLNGVNSEDTKTWVARIKNRYEKAKLNP